MLQVEEKTDYPEKYSGRYRLEHKKINERDAEEGRIVEYAGNIESRISPVNDDNGVYAGTPIGLLVESRVYNVESRYPEERE